MKRALFLFSFLFSAYLFAQNSNVLYGEHDVKNTNTALYFDKAGNLYPDYIIQNTSLENSNASLAEWYRKNESAFIKIGAQYGCTFSACNSENVAVLNDSIIGAFKQRIRNSIAAGKSITFLIHGYRKPFKTMNGDVSSSVNFESMKESINKSLPKTQYVEVYWDAMYGCCFSASTKNNEPLFKLFEEAQNNAVLVGKGLKKVLLSTNSNVINIYTHSLGAKVASYALLNIDNENIPTPSNPRINICLVAPAISADLLLNNYAKRNSTVDYKNNDNYKLSIVYNEKDFALKKKDNILGLWGPGPYKFGNTTLGCNYKNTAVKLKTFLLSKLPHASIELFNLSFIGKCHHISCYTDHFESVLQCIND